MTPSTVWLIMIVSVTISTTNTDHPYFQGFFLQAHSADCMSSTVARGFFVGPLDSNTQSMTCRGPFSNVRIANQRMTRGSNVDAYVISRRKNVYMRIKILKHV